MTTYTSPHYGLRAPNDDELARNGAAALRTLALDVDTAVYDELSSIPGAVNKVVQGSTVATPNASGLLSVTFPVGSFTSAPRVVVSNGDSGNFGGYMELQEPPTSTGFVVSAKTMAPAVHAFVRAYAEWAVNHAEAVYGPIPVRMKAGATGAPVPTLYPTGMVRVNWIAVGDV